jgi:hypothetical protein
MMGTSHERSRASATTWVVRSLVIVVTATLIVAVRRSRSRGREHTGPMIGSPMARSLTPRTAHLETESPEPDVLDQRQAAWPDPVDEFPAEIPLEQPEADVLEQWREVLVEEEPQVVDEPPRDR